MKWGIDLPIPSGSICPVSTAQVLGILPFWLESWLFDENGVAYNYYALVLFRGLRIFRVLRFWRLSRESRLMMLFYKVTC